MPMRKMIEIEDAKCNGCGKCVNGCAEGALAIVDGKARVIKEQFCDGFGDCIGECPTGALKLVDREAPLFDETAVRTHLVQLRGPAGVKRFNEAQRAHEKGQHPPAPSAEAAHGHGGGGCPGTRMRMAIQKDGGKTAVTVTGNDMPALVQKPDLDQWPVQLHLVPPSAPFFKNRELVLLSTCSPIASADVHWRFIRGRGVVVACPKLDRREGYVEKLAAILSEPTIPKIIVVRMEVPCCGGLTAMVEEALAACGRSDLHAEEVTMGLDGAIRSTAPIQPRM